MRVRSAIAAAGALTVGLAAPLQAQRPQDLKALTIEELMDIDVTVASRRPEPVRAAAAAVSVITRDDIRRSGATTIADALWLAAGVHVARLNNGVWGVSVRGFNAPAANKLLVMIDGRTVYSPLFTGVFWNTVDYFLEDVERIEVIRGPGATLWGANAVNGVINVITRPTADTRGTAIVLGGGVEDTAQAGARYGGALGPGTFRVYGKYDRREPGRLSAGGPAGDRRDRGQAGFRFDAERGADAWMITADAFHSEQRFSDLADGAFSRASVQARWSRVLGSGAQLRAQSFYQRESRDVPRQITYDLDTVDLELQFATTLRRRHAIVTGGGYGVSRDDTTGGTVAFDPPDRTYPLWHLFVQDEFAWVPDRVFVTGGLKLEHNAFSGGEWQPTARVRVEPARGHTLWAALSRPVRRPTRLDVDLINSSVSGIVTAVGSEDFQAETLLALDGGYRVQPSAEFSAEAVVFQYAYDRLRSTEPGNPGPLPVRIGNGLNGSSRGVELSAIAQPAPGWRTRASYTYQRVHVTPDASSRDVSRGSAEANDPRHLFTLSQSLGAGPLEADLMLRRVGALPFPAVPAYTELDARIGWRANSSLDVALAGRDLLHPHHAEFGPSPSQPRRAEPERSVRLTLSVRF